MVEMKDILRGLREQKQVSMDKMCEDLNNIYNVALAKSTISKWENGKAEPSLAYARILTKYFNVTLDYLLGLEKEEMYNFNKLLKEETILLENYNKLNDLGKNEAIKRVEELTYIDKYKNTKVVELPTKKKEVWEEEGKDHLMPVAAHDDGLTDEEKENMNNIIDNFLKNKK
ncbi:helix-turn-helix transcriptional regulator [Clostridium sp.]|uniref:helix-turn-helix domain-containing protein n=1 Tax=Clostridium sp. TaxID=1506 RepID=UPI002A85B02F|nr:helix-turn-helix transcriptional regulator [Clostridium sp.]